MQRNLVVLLSDLHFGKETDTFDSDIARERLEMIPDMIAGAPSLKDCNKLHLMLMGDIIEGQTHIFPSQATQVSQHELEQKSLAASALEVCVQGLLKIFPSLCIHTIAGNHGHTGRRGHPVANWDNAVYDELRVRLRGSGARMSINHGEIAPVKVGRTTGIITHKGVPHIGTPARQLKFLSWLVEYGASWMACGHWHTWGIPSYQSWPLIINGSLSGPDSFSDVIAKYSPARQGFFFEEGGELFGFSYLGWE